MSKPFSVVEHFNHFAVRDNATGEEVPMGDGVDTLCDAEGNSLIPGTPSFIQNWEEALNFNAAETREAYFPHTLEAA